jgi:hypothetical protein
MPQAERWHHRDEAYSYWHRTRSIGRFLRAAEARELGMIDVDVTLYCEYRDSTKVPVCLIETAEDYDQQWKEARVTATLAQMAGLPAFCVLYTLGPTPLPGHELLKDITALRVRQLAPEESHRWTTYTPAEWAQHLLAVRRQVPQTRPPDALVLRALNDSTGRCVTCHLFVPVGLIFLGECERCRQAPPQEAL